MNTAKRIARASSNGRVGPNVKNTVTTLGSGNLAKSLKNQVTPTKNVGYHKLKGAVSG